MSTAGSRHPGGACRAPWSVPKTEHAFPWGNVTMYDTTIGWRYPNKKMEEIIPLEGMGQTAENIRDETEIGREEQDAFAHSSQEKYDAANKAEKLPHKNKSFFEDIIVFTFSVWIRFLFSIPWFDLICVCWMWKFLRRGFPTGFVCS